MAVDFEERLDGTIVDHNLHIVQMLLDVGRPQRLDRPSSFRLI